MPYGSNVMLLCPRTLRCFEAVGYRTRLSQRVGRGNERRGACGWRLVWAAAALVLAGAGIARAGVGVWTMAGPSGVPTTVLAIDPVTPATIYVGTPFDGVFKSTDGGAHWAAASTGLSNPFGYDYLPVEAVLIDPIVPSTVYALVGGGIFKSADGGASWTAAKTGLYLERFISALAIDPMTPTTLYLGTNGGTGQTSDDGVFKSTDGGASWTAVNNGLTAPYGLYVSPWRSIPRCRPRSMPRPVGESSRARMAERVGNPAPAPASSESHVSGLTIDP